MFNKIKSLKLDDYIEIRKAEYTIFKLIPSKSTKNNATDKMVELINEMVVTLNKRFKKEGKKLIIQTNLKTSYYIHIAKSGIEFYLMIPSFFADRYKVKCQEIWKNVVLEQVSALPTDFNNSTKYSLEYTRNDALSLKVDKRTNELLENNLTIVESLEEGEYVGLFYNFIPMQSKENNYFRIKSKELVEKYRCGEHLKRRYSFLDMLGLAFRFAIDLFDSFVDFITDKKDSKPTFLTAPNHITNSTTKKLTSSTCKTQIAIVSKSKDKEKEKILCKTTASSFSCINGNNSLYAKKVKTNINPTATIISNCRENITSSLECQNFISIAGAEILNKYNIEHIKILEKNIPKCLEKGVIRIGKVKVKDITKEAFFSTDEQIQRMSRYLLGSGGSGKSHKLICWAKNIIQARDRGFIILDYIQDCGVSETIKTFTPKDRLIEINCSDPNQLQSFAFNELTFGNNATNVDKLNIAMQKASQFQLLLDSINADSNLTPRMIRYLYAGAIISFFVNPNASLKDCVDILQNPYKRLELFNKLSDKEKELLKDEIDDLNSLTKEDKKTGDLENADSKIDGILDRISWLSSTNVFTKLAYKKDSENNINFVEAIKEKKIILIKIPESKFPNRETRNIIATFFLSKIWLSKQILGEKNELTELFIDEIHQCPNCQLLLENILVEHRKYKLIPTLSLHYIGQCKAGNLKESILNSGGSFMILNGASPKAFDDLNVLFEKEGYVKEDIAELKKRQALCLIKNEETNYSAFVADLEEKI